ncbi:MAG: cysteine synthase family protein [Chloroflexi bacterium]|nr:cysteine synthase family protein [Chloroflexota bacterium]
MYNYPVPPATLLGLIGNTPLVELPRLAPKPGIRLFAKLEGQNPSGSVKDRIVLAMIEAAEQRGELKPGDTIVEASSGNTAIALAMMGKQKGYGVQVVIPRGVTPSVADILGLCGAEVTWCEPRAGLKGAIDLALNMAATRGYYPLQQFASQVNVEVHYHTTGKEIAEALPEVDLFVAGVGTGGTIMGVGRRLRESSPNVQVIGVEPALGERLQGLRSLAEGFVPPLLDLQQLDGRFLVDSASAIAAARSVAQAEGLLAGVSSGATLHAALRLAQRMDKGNIVVMFSDGGWKYLPAKPWDAAKEGSRTLDEVHWW